MKQINDEYVPNNLVDHFLAVFILKHPNNLSILLWHEKLDTCVEFDQFTIIWEYICKSEKLGNNDTLSTDYQKESKI